METVRSEVRTPGYGTFLNRAGRGNGEAILLLHGSGPGANAWSNWQFVLPTLGERFDCLAPDLVGFGESEHPRPEEYPVGMKAWLDVWVEQGLGLLDELGIEKAHVVGNSMGGAVALHLVDRHPERFGRMALMGPAGPPHELSGQLDDVWGFYEDPTVGHMVELINLFAYDPKAAVGDDLEKIAGIRMEAAMRPEVRRSFEAMFPPPRQRHLDDLVLPEESLHDMDRPALLIHGRDDGIVPMETSMYLLRHLPRVQFHAIGRCSHWTMIEYPKAFNNLLLDFFAGRL